MVSDAAAHHRVGRCRPPPQGPRGRIRVHRGGVTAPGATTSSHTQLKQRGLELQLQAEVRRAGESVLPWATETLTAVALGARLSPAPCATATPSARRRPRGLRITGRGPARCPCQGRSTALDTRTVIPIENRRAAAEGATRSPSSSTRSSRPGRAVVEVGHEAVAAGLDVLHEALDRPLRRPAIA